MEEITYTIITGASTGIGKALAQEMASRKHNLILQSLPDENLEVFCKQLENDYGVRTLCFECDLTLPEGPRALYEFTQNRKCRIDILVNNAGIGFEGPIEDYPESQIDYMILLNIRAMTLLTHFFTRELKTHREAYILFLSSFGIYIPSAYKSIYLASKTYIYYLSLSLRSEFSGTPVRTCVIVPSGVRTNSNTLDRIRRGGWVSQRSALEPEEVASIAIKGMLKGRKVIIPGSLTNLFFIIGNVLPQGLMLRTARRIFRNYRLAD